MAGVTRVPVLNLIGPVGIGKSTVADALADILAYDYGIPHAVVDLDHVRRAFPPPPDDPFHMALGFRNLAAVWQNYAEAGARCLIVPSVMESAGDLAALAAAVPGADVFVVRLTAAPEVNAARIRGREHSAAALAWCLNRAAQLAHELAEKRLEHVVVATDGKTPRAVAEEVLERWGVARDPTCRHPDRLDDSAPSS
jgi:adenylylsulfate kinase